MPKASVKRIINKKKKKLIEFVLDIEKYPEFIPFCLGSKIYERIEENNQIFIIADLKIGTLGHSDGDPVLHAVTDAVLGACAMGDIGQKFSNKNKEFKNIRSTILLDKVINQIKLKGFIINNLDINIITEKPKIQKYNKKITKCISKICKILPSQINIKGKTTEKLGVIGKEKAIACEAIVSVIKND